ncbi:hypothetical protein ABS71_12125 [bacterium SCN 62-11]|mgnify:CR=1 FL=1|nr:MAG: hypothetical protein ABS71_12125 [bacterium SCN 62-11]
MEWLKTEGHRIRFQQSQGEGSESRFLAWDVVRMAQVVRWGVRAGWVPTREAWRWLESAGELAAANFSSWESYLNDYELGFRAWSDSLEEAQKVAQAVATVKAGSLPAWAPARQPLPSPLAYRWRSVRRKTSLNSQLRLVFIALLVLVASIMKPVPLGLCSLVAVLLTLALRSKLWGATAELLLGLCGFGFVALSVVGGALRARLPENLELPLAGLIFGGLAAYCLAFFFIYSDDRTPAQG